jgi:hypothetical protein
MIFNTEKGDKTMIPKYTVEYAATFRKHAQPGHYSTDDPVTCEEFIEELLDRGFAIHAIKHEGVELQKPEFDKLVRDAANVLASRKICASLGIKPEEERFRFGFAA